MDYQVHYLGPFLSQTVYLLQPYLAFFILSLDRHVKFDTEIHKGSPTQLYESIVGFYVFSIMAKKNKEFKTWSQFFVYLILAGVEILVEFIRTNEKYLFDIFSGAQVISLIMVFIGSYFLFIH